MWPLNTRPSERSFGRPRAGAVAARAALCATCLVWFVLASQAEGTARAATSPPLRDEDVRRAEKVLAKLRLLNEAARDDAKAFRAVAAKLYPGLFITVADMRAGGLKTDLDTAVFLHEELSRTWFTTGAETADCGRERPDIYLPLCLDLRGGTVRQLLLSKARLHVRWAEAVIKDFRGQGNAETSRALAAMKAARENDLVIAERVLATLKTLDGLVNASPTYADYEEQERHTLARVGFGQLDRKFGDALRGAGALLAQMPRSQTFYYLSSARRGYMDGLFWCRKVHQSRKQTVSASGFERDPLKDLRLDADQVGYTVVVNWRTAMKYLRLAEQSLSGL